MKSPRPTDKLIIYRCFLCKQPFQFDPHAYLGKYIRQWDIEVCSQCYGGNHDGVVVEQHPDLREHLNTKGIPVQLNDRGWLDWPPY